MKKILFFLGFLIVCIISFGQSIVPRSNSSITVQDSRFSAQFNLFVPRYADTTAANLQKGIDSSGAIIYTSDVNDLWFRKGNPKRWTKITNLMAIPWGSITGNISDQADLVDSLNKKLNISDTAAMLSHYLTTVDTTNIPEFWKKVRSLLNAGYGISYSNGTISSDSVTLAGYFLRRGDSTVYYPYASNPLGYITANDLPVKGNGWLTSPTIVWLHNYTYWVGNGTYAIGGKVYQFNGDSITLAAADPSLDRIDIIVLDTSENVMSISGTPSATPEKPIPDGTYQIEVTLVYVTAATTQPATPPTSVIIRDEGSVGEWTISKTMTSTDNYATNPYHGSISQRLTSAGSGQYIQWTAASTQSKITFNNLVLYIRNNAALSGLRNMQVRLYNGSTQVGNWVNPTSWGYSKTITGSYQVIGIPMSAFGGADAFDRLRITNSGFAGTLDVQLDYIQLQSGVTQVSSGSSNSITTLVGNTGSVSVSTPNASVNIVGSNGLTTTASGSTVTIDGIAKVNVADSITKYVTPTQLNGQGFITRSGLSATAPLSYNSGTGLFDLKYGNGLKLVPTGDTLGIGGLLTRNDTLFAQNLYSLTIYGNKKPSDYLFKVINDSDGNGTYSYSKSGYGVYGYSISGSGIGGYSTSGNGLLIGSSDNYGAYIYNNSRNISALYVTSQYQDSSIVNFPITLNNNPLNKSIPGSGVGISFTNTLRQTGQPVIGKILFSQSDTSYTSHHSYFDIIGDSAALQTKFARFKEGGLVMVNNLNDTLATKAYARSVGGGGGSSSLSGLTDVNISSPSNLQLLQYQTGDSKWHNFTPNYLAASDTSNKWVNNITRTPGKDSIIFYVGSTRYAIKDSVGTGGGGGGTWGSITGTLSSQTDLQSALDAKEPTITASNTVKKYWNGYKQWVALNSDSLTEGSTNLFYTDARSRAALSASAPLSYNSGTGAFSISQANTSTNGYLSNTDWNTFNNKFTLPSLTSGSVLFSNGTTIAQDNSNLFWDNTNKRLGIKVNNPGYTLQVRGDAYLDSSQLTVNMSNFDKGITVNQWGGGSGYFKINSASSGGMLPAFNAKSTYAGNGVMFIASGYNTYSDGAIVFSGRNAAGTGSITGGTLVDFKNYLTSYLNIDYTGRVGIGVTSPTGVVHIKAGTATAGTAPLKFTAGTNLTTTEAGAVEFDGTHLYFTATNGGTRYQLDQQSGGASALSGLTDVNVSSPSNLQLLQYQTGDSKWHNWTPNYITGNQTITLSGDATGSGATSISTTVGKINGTSLAGLATGILKNTTGTGVPSIAVAGDFPTLNQNTTGSAATLTTTRTIWGQNFNGSANVTGNITLGTSNITMTGSIASTGSRVTKGWFTDLESSNVPTVGGTSLTTLSQTFQNKTLTNSNNVLGGVTMTLGSDANYDIYYRNNSGVLTRLAAGTDGQVLTTHSTTSAPTWTTVSGSTQNLSWNSGTHAVDISGGGTSAVIPLATSSINGLSSSTDKAFLDSLRSHNSYIRNSIAIGDSLLTKKNDSTLIARRLSLTAGDNMTIATTGSNDSLLKYTIDVKNDTTALFTFGAGSGASGDTTAFSTSALYGSFYNAGSDSLIITSINAVMQGSNDTLKISVCFSDTLKAVSPSYVLNSYSINNNSVGKNATSGDFTTAKIPPGKHVYCLSPYVLAGRKPTYLSVTVIGYKKRKL